MMSFLVRASSSSRSSGPELPMQVVQPNPTSLEAQAIEERLQARLGEVLAHHARARRERGLHPRLDAEAAFDRLLRQETGRQHDRRVGGVGARSDGGDHDVPMGQLVAGRSRGRRTNLAEPIRRRSIVHHLGLGQGIRVLRRATRERVIRLVAPARAGLCSVSVPTLTDRPISAAGFP